MPTPNVLGAVTLDIASASPGALSVAVPSGSQGVVVFWRAAFPESLALTSSFAGTFQDLAPSADFYVRIQVAPVTSTGSQTITPVFSDSLFEGPVFSLVFVDAIDNSDFANWVRDWACSGAAAQTVDSTADDLVIAFDNWFTDSATAPTNQTGWTSLVTQTYNNNGARTRTADSPGASTTTATSQTGAGGDFSGMALISLIGASGSTSHDGSGALVGQGSTIAGSAQHNTPHASSGALTGPGAAIVGSAARTRAHPSSGALTGPGSTVAGSSARFRAFAASGALVGPGSVVSGTAARLGPAVSHDASGALVGIGSLVSGFAQNGTIAPDAEPTPTYVVGKKPKKKERKLMGGPRWQPYELADLSKFVQGKPFEEAQQEADKQAQDAISKAARQEEIDSITGVAQALELLANNEATEALALEAAILAEQQALEDAQIMAVIAELL